jgi:hypothetical protein
MKKNKLIASCLVLLFTFTACEKDLLDINVNPNSLQDTTHDLLFPSGVMFSAGKIGGDLQLFGSLWAQHYTQNNNSSQYRTLEQYNVSVSAYNGIWTYLWAGALRDLKVARDKATAAGAWQYYLAATVMSAFDYHLLNDFYGSIPLQEGLELLDNANPKFVENEEANTLIIALLDDAISKAAQAKALPSMLNQDIVFQGDIDNWVKFAKSLKLKILMRDFNANTAAIQALLEENDLLNDLDAKVDVFEDAENKSNPLYEQDRRKLNTRGNLRASNTLLKYLKANNDPRIAFLYETTAADPSAYVGIEQGNYTLNGVGYSNADHSAAKFSAEDPVYFVSEVEVAFLKAEAYARLGNVLAAKTHYEAGVSKAFERAGFATQAASFLAPTGKYAFHVVAAPGDLVDHLVEQIIMQKWVASARTQAWDAFLDQNRTGFPRVSTVATTDPAYVPGRYTISRNSTLAAGELPRRLLYPKVSSDYNTNAPTVVPINTKMWWHK